MAIIPIDQQKSLDTLLDGSKGNVPSFSVTSKQETLLLQKLALLEDVDKNLQKKREEYKGELKEKKHGLRQDMEKFRSFISDNAQKRRRSRAKYEQETKLVEEYKSQLDQLNQKLDKVKKRYDFLYTTVTKYQPLIDFLRKIVDALPKDYIKNADDTLRGLIQRFENLAYRRGVFQAMLAKFAETKSRLHYEEFELFENFNQYIFSTSSEMSELYTVKDTITKELSIANTECAEKLERLRSDVTKYGLIIRAVDSMCAKCVRDYHLYENEWSFETKLSKIKLHILNSKSIVEKVRYLNTKASSR